MASEMETAKMMTKEEEEEEKEKSSGHSEMERSHDDDDVKNEENISISSDRKEGEERVFPCTYCLRKFTTPQALGGHQNAHRKEKTSALKTREPEFFTPSPYNHYHFNHQRSPSQHVYNYSSPTSATRGILTSNSHDKIYYSNLPYDYSRFYTTTPPTILKNDAASAAAAAAAFPSSSMAGVSLWHGKMKGEDERRSLQLLQPLMLPNGRWWTGGRNGKGKDGALVHLNQQPDPKDGDAIDLTLRL